MQSADAILAFEALSSPTRLALFRLLVRHAPEGLVAGELANSLGISATNLSFHLKALSHAGLATASAEGRFLRYRAQLERMNAVVAFLTEECCQGRPELCGMDANKPAAAPPVSGKLAFRRGTRA